jgi:hypothetical protein
MAKKASYEPGNSTIKVALTTSVSKTKLEEFKGFVATSQPSVGSKVDDTPSWFRASCRFTGRETAATWAVRNKLKMTSTKAVIEAKKNKAIMRIGERRPASPQEKAERKKGKRATGVPPRNSNFEGKKQATRIRWVPSRWWVGQPCCRRADGGPDFRAPAGDMCSQSDARGH